MISKVTGYFFDDFFSREIFLFLVFNRKFCVVKIVEFHIKEKSFVLSGNLMKFFAIFFVVQCATKSQTGLAEEDFQLIFLLVPFSGAVYSLKASFCTFNKTTL